MKTRKWLLYSSLFAAGMISLVLDSGLDSLVSSMKNAAFDTAFGLFSDSVFLTSLFMAAILILLFTKKNRQLVRSLWAFAAGFLVSHILKLMIQRARPFSDEKELFLTKLPDYSFPSSHAVVAFAMLPVFMAAYPKQRWIFITTACLIAVSRFYLGMHHLSDVILGSLIGLLIGEHLMRK